MPLKKFATIFCSPKPTPTPTAPPNTARTDKSMPTLPTATSTATVTSMNSPPRKNSHTSGRAPVSTVFR